MQITNRWMGAVMFECDARTIVATLKKAIQAFTDLRNADLRSADLSNADLRSADLSGAVLRSADLRGADLSNADLSGADLSNADLRDAILRNADLRDAILRNTDLSGADLRSADLSGARGTDRWLTTPLMLFLDQPGPMRAYKLVTADGKSPMHSSKIQYAIGESHEVKGDTDEHVDCSFGINLATFDWCMKEYKPGWRVFIAEFEAKDIACIPIGTDGKFRVHRCKIVGEKDLAPVLKGMKGK